MSDERARMQILEMIENGKISASEGLQLLEAMANKDGQTELEPGEAVQDLSPEDGTNTARIPIYESTSAGSVSEGHAAHDIGHAAHDIGHAAHGAAPPIEPDLISGIHEAEHSFPPNIGKWKQWWTIPMAVGVGITVSGGLLMFWVLQAAGISVWFFLAMIPFLFGLGVMILSWQSRTSRWLHLRIDQNDPGHPRHLAISLPLPTRLAAWFFRRFGNKLSGLDGIPIEQMILALDTSTNPENPLFFVVEDEENGERVEIYIG